MNNKLKLFFKPLCASLALFLVAITPAFAHPTITRGSKSSQSAAGTYSLHEGSKHMTFSVTLARTSSSKGKFYHIVALSKGNARVGGTEVSESQLEAAMVSFFNSH